MDSDNSFKNKQLINYNNNLIQFNKQYSNYSNTNNNHSGYKNRKSIKFITKKSIVKNKKIINPRKLNPNMLGLKEISKKVCDIMNENRYNSYKLVVDEFFKRYELEEKDKKNIKRRIYDALNVIKASNEVLNKEKENSKKISCNIDKLTVSLLYFY